jgi:hypothetical protein
MLGKGQIKPGVLLCFSVYERQQINPYGGSSRDVVNYALNTGCTADRPFGCTVRVPPTATLCAQHRLTSVMGQATLKGRGIHQ